MADAAPSAPTEQPKTVKVPASKPLVAAVVLALLIGLGALGLAGWHHFHPQPSPTPTRPPPAPAAGPVAKVSGLYFPLAGPGVRGAPTAPIGLIRVSAEGSKSDHPIKWKVHGPATLSLTVFSPEGGLGSSIAEAYPTVPGTYRIHGIARGTTAGQPDADIDSYEVEVGDSPAPPAPPEPPPGPPDPPKPPDPPPVNPDTPPNDPSIDPKFWTLGRAYSGTLSGTYADALDSGATMLAAGTPLSQAMGTITQKWGAGRQAAFDKLLTPEFSKIIPESTKDADITAAQRDAMAKACRGLAAGLRK